MDQSSESRELVKPLSQELEKAIRLMKDHPEARIEFTSFVATFAAILKKNSLTFTTQLLHEQIASQVKPDEEAQTQKNREELIKLLTANLTKEKILT